MVQRQTFRRHVPWATKSNRHRKIKTPGGKLVYHIVKKTTNRAKCGDTGRYLNGVKIARGKGLRKLKQRERKVSRAYGGCLTAGAVKDRIMRAFLIEEQRCVKQVMETKAEAPKEAKKDDKKKDGEKKKKKKKTSA